MYVWGRSEHSGAHEQHAAAESGRQAACEDCRSCQPAERAGVVAGDHVAEAIEERDARDQIEDTCGYGYVGGGAKGEQAVGGPEDRRDECAQDQCGPEVHAGFRQYEFERIACCGGCEYRGHRRCVAAEQPAE